jgi:hypothetical protein
VCLFSASVVPETTKRILKNNESERQPLTKNIAFFSSQNVLFETFFETTNVYDNEKKKVF